MDRYAKIKFIFQSVRVPISLVQKIGSKMLVEVLTSLYVVYAFTEITLSKSEGKCKNSNNNSRNNHRKDGDIHITTTKTSFQSIILQKINQLLLIKQELKYGFVVVIILQIVHFLAKIDTSSGLVGSICQSTIFFTSAPYRLLRVIFVSKSE